MPAGLIVSCQAYEGDPMFGADLMAAMARAAAMGGAIAIRANSPTDIAAIRAAVMLPVIGLWKLFTPGSDVYITPTCDSATALAQAGAHMIAVDATPRPRANGETLAQVIAHCHDALKLPVMADVSCIDDARAAAESGADVLSTTMAGYTAHGRAKTDGPDLDFLSELVAWADRPVIAEGRFSQPDEVTRAFELGAHAVVIGAAITRPEVITARFVRAAAQRRGLSNVTGT
jgi:N-acylglucosamine-6-phosphate 2-epimerase